MTRYENFIPNIKEITCNYFGVSANKQIGVVAHDTAGGSSDTAYANAEQSASNYNNGFAHYYVDEDSATQIAPESACAYHTGTTYGNTEFVGVETCRTLPGGDFENDEQRELFYKAYENSCILIAEILTRQGYKKATYDNLKFHNEFKATACPYTKKVYFGSYDKAHADMIAKVNEIMTGEPSVDPVEPVEPDKPTSGYDKEYNMKHSVYFKNNVSINTSPKYGATSGTQYNKGETLKKADEVIYNDGYIWSGYNRGNGSRGYVATGTYNKSNLKTTETWVSIGEYGATGGSTSSLPEYVTKEYGEKGSFKFTHQTPVYGNLTDAINDKNRVTTYYSGEVLNNYEYIYETKYTKDNSKAFEYTRYVRANGTIGIFASKNYQTGFVPGKATKK